jgi:D-alanyl-D-alanine carboxypeptidase
MNVVARSGRTAVVCLAAALCSGRAFAAPAPDDRSIDAGVRAKIDAAARDMVAARHGTATTIAVAQHGRIVFARGYGWRDVRAKLPAGVGTRYEIGSITKQFGAAAIVQLHEAGKIDLDAKLAAYLPDAPHAGEVTIRQLLTQTSGLPEYFDGPDLESRAGVRTTFARLMARIAGKPLDFKPGTTFAYSNTNYAVLSRVVEVIAHQSWDAYLKKNLFARAGMVQSGTMADEARLSAMARGYVLQNGTVRSAPPLDDSWVGAAGNVVSTAGDLQRWGAALTSGKIISRADYALLTTPPRLPSGATSTYGFGMVIDRFDGQPRVWHNGSSFGFNATDAFFPRQDVRIIALTNDADAPSGTLVARIFADLFPAIAAAQAKPRPGEDAAVTARIKTFITAFDHGHADRTQMTESANRAWPDALVANVAARFRTRGDPTWIYRGMRAGSHGPVYFYLLRYPDENLYLTVQLDKSTHRFAFFFVGRTDALWHER